MSAVVCSQNHNEAFFLFNFCFSSHNWCVDAQLGAEARLGSAEVLRGISASLRCAEPSLFEGEMRSLALHWGWSSWNVPDGGSDSPECYGITAAAQWHRDRKGISSGMTCMKSGNSAHLWCCTEGNLHRTGETEPKKTPKLPTPVQPAVNALSIGKELPIIAACVPWAPSPLWNLVSFSAPSCYLIFLRWEDTFWQVSFSQIFAVSGNREWCLALVHLRCREAVAQIYRCVPGRSETLVLKCLCGLRALVQIGAGTDLRSPQSVFHTVKMCTWIRHVKGRFGLSEVEM